MASLACCLERGLCGWGRTLSTGRGGNNHICCIWCRGLKQIDNWLAAITERPDEAGPLSRYPIPYRLDCRGIKQGTGSDMTPPISGVNPTSRVVVVDCSLACCDSPTCSLACCSTHSLAWRARIPSYIVPHSNLYSYARLYICLCWC